MGWVASHEHIILPFGTSQPCALPSADNKATEAADNKERMGVRHDIVWCRQEAATHPPTPPMSEVGWVLLGAVLENWVYNFTYF